jgi:hypothetical protein
MLGREQARRIGRRAHLRKERLATSPASNRPRFLLNVVADQTASSILSPTNQRNSRL